jgi:hypothetical protein
MKLSCCGHPIKSLWLSLCTERRNEISNLVDYTVGGTGLPCDKTTGKKLVSKKCNEIHFNTLL